ncbi:HAMP domain-containing histidine kinase [Moritella marina ATCC 15381]|uniref:histidine kinase n=1 Tax=Moritella marina ATCC 15381 TaxID=1202962 RepID=A0A5J6WHI3_MORMI|nr:HAMP domain-containing sensor histidine kinase [Moritella marina]QFI37486.1 HAMP domain-containing histidine kinase [Moritella marina ATCC 15381]
MAKVRSAKQLTFIYFSIVAFVIILIHGTVLDSTLESIEKLSIQNRLLLQKESIVEKSKLSDKARSFKIDEFTTGYIDRVTLPGLVDENIFLPVDEAVEIQQKNSLGTEFFIMKLAVSGQQESFIYVVHNDPAFELGEEEIMWTQSSQSLTSLVLLLIALLVVMRISERLTAPLSVFAKQIASRSPDDTSDIELPSGIATKELLQLVDSYNKNQQQKNALIERERAFNRMASHELRTPLMVMKGATNLLSYSNEPEFIKKQQIRLQSATNEMNDFIDALLSLTKSEQDLALSQRLLNKDEIMAIVDTHSALLNAKPVVVNIEIKQKLVLSMPEVAFKLLLGNLLKNAFHCTAIGEVNIVVDDQSVSVIDTGCGLYNKQRGDEGHGLGLLITRDICRKYNWQFELKNIDAGGCCATIFT